MDTTAWTLGRRFLPGLVLLLQASLPTGRPLFADPDVVHFLETSQEADYWKGPAGCLSRITDSWECFRKFHRLQVYGLSDPPCRCTRLGNPLSVNRYRHRLGTTACTIYCTSQKLLFLRNDLQTVQVRLFWTKYCVKFHPARCSVHSQSKPFTRRRVLSKNTQAEDAIGGMGEDLA